MRLPIPRSLNSLLVLLALAAPALANAQAYQCRVPSVSAVPKITPDGRPRPLPVTGYTLALSWSPAFCRTRQSSRSHAMQCSGNYGRFGLVVHGLWPESATRSRRTWPQWCPTKNRLSPAEIRRNMCMMPSSRLVARQWAKHGSCMTRRPETYLQASPAFCGRALRIPDYDRISREEGLTAGRIRRSLRRVPMAQAGRRAHVGVKLNERRLAAGNPHLLLWPALSCPARCDNAGRFGASDRDESGRRSGGDSVDKY